jgi:hypothetical protein
VTVEEVGVEGMTNQHDPTCDLFDRLNALKNDEELMDLATGFVLQLLRSAQEETLRRGHVASKVSTFQVKTMAWRVILMTRSFHDDVRHSNLNLSFFLCL